MVEGRIGQKKIINLFLNEEYRANGIKPVTLNLVCDTCGQQYQVSKYPTKAAKPSLGTEPKAEVIGNIRQTVLFDHFSKAKCEGPFTFNEV